MRDAKFSDGHPGRGIWGFEARKGRVSSSSGIRGPARGRQNERRLDAVVVRGK